MTEPTPPPYPPPGWGFGGPPGGCHWVWKRAHDGWQIDSTPRPCRWMEQRKQCRRPSVATLDRGRDKPRLYGYCELHLYGRHIHDGAVWDCAAEPVGTSS